uniref:BZIP domain-containing protein n=1 Tax=Cyclophora tenuis TaxID=216820 RepID=A0A6U1S8L5_CYCTE|mmetsp:Transcript_4721/g.8196  ORF Transcript_4721/g.8196 Transcript_4721/m.8196 type:complete len:362 (+) Transcript_4721:112-1197(+)|eukprot:CAMPEP_0116553880 /NCGR_PEP_ID=MMETSP0397-20121206/7286_1 /TAXON_ID=216820 /ORGANISM="Cyclophora tenuis, Strain ECT3854" /LENGTH=361 /DNA_ID=CAMNT_0004078987 /DNA_START=10 /DNA_END=1095 /DNA_ORIENTATION=+
MTTEVTELNVDDTTNEEVKVGQNVPMKKRKKTDVGESETAEFFDDSKRVKIEDAVGVVDDAVAVAGEDEGLRPIKRAPMSKAREIRLEQNRKAARESRRRKKVMIEELQRSVIFFSRANGTLKQQNDELSRILMQAQAQIAATESGQQGAQDNQQQPNTTESSTPDQNGAANTPSQIQFQNMAQQAQAQAVATQAMYESQGFPPAAARAAAQTINASTPAAAAGQPAQTPAAPAPGQGLPQMQPGATMQAMANFQQAAAAAMQAAMGMNPASAAANSANTAAPTQQSYTDTLNALAMQQAAAVGQAQFAVLGIPQNVPNTTFMTHPGMMTGAPIAWQQPGAPAPAPQAAPAPQPAAQQASG